MTVPVFDAHLHIIDPDFPLIENQGYLPEPFTVQDYRDRSRSLNIQGGAVVSGSFQGLDQTYLKQALRQLGPNFVGVSQLPASVSSAELTELDQCGVRAIRFNVQRGGSETLDQLEHMAQRVFDLVGWHTELYIDCAGIEALLPTLKRLPQISIDHLGLSKAGLPNLLQLVECGAKVKATGFGRLDFSVPEVLQAIDRCNPEALLFGTDLPGTRAPRPFDPTDLALLLETLGDAAAERILWRNAARLYRLPPSTPH